VPHPPIDHQHPGEPGHPGQPAAPDQSWDAAPPPGQPPYGQPPYGQPAYPQPAYPQPAYGSLQHGPQPWQPWPPYAVPPPNRTGLLWGLVAALATIALVLTVLLVVRPGPDLEAMSGRPVPVPAPAATLAPTGLGADADLDRLAQQCSDGQMNPCDDLYDESFPGSGYEAYGDTCAGRRTAGEDTYCADVFYDS